MVSGLENTLNNAVDSYIQQNNPNPANIIISCGHNTYNGNQKTIDQEIIAAADEYRAKDLMPSYKFKRVNGNGTDENKFLIGIYENLSSVALQMIPAAIGGHRVCVVGSKEVGTYVNEMRDYLSKEYGVNRDNIIFKKEGKSIGDNIAGGKKALEERFGKLDKYMFWTGDIPFSNLNRMINQYNTFDGKKHKAWLDLNGQKSIFRNGSELFTRNYYQHLIERVSGLWRANPIKEPNVFFISGSLDVEKIANTLYNFREMGKLTKQLAKPINYIKCGISNLFSTNGIQNNNNNNKEKKPIRFKASSLTALARPLIGRIKITAEHSDPFRLKDIDAWHDLIYYREIARQLHSAKAGHDGFHTIYDQQTADALYGFNDHMKARGEKSPELSSTLKLVLAADEYIEKRSRALDIKEYFDADGNFREVVRDDEDIAASIDYLIENKIKNQKEEIRKAA